MKNRKPSSEVIKTVIASSFPKKEVDAAKRTLNPFETLTGEITARFPFSITKAEDTDAKPTASLLTLTVLSEALVYAGITAPAFKTTLAKAFKKALKNSLKISTVIKKQDPRVLEMTEQIQAIIAKLPTQVRSGSTKVTILTEDGTPEILSSSLK